MEAVTSITGKNRAFNYGDGCFTTIAVFDHLPQLLSRHIKRLDHDANALGIRLSDCVVHDLTSVSSKVTVLEDFSQLADHIIGLAKASPAKSVIKVLIARGDGGRGYGVDGVGPTQVYLSVFDWPQHYDSLLEQGVSVGVSSIWLANQPRLAGLKHLNRLEQVMIKQELATTQFDDALVLNSHGYITEASAANVFWLTKSGQWQTPNLSEGGVNGVFRQLTLDVMAENNLDCQVVSAGLDIIETMQAAFLCNALMGVVPIRSIHCTGKNYALDTDAINDLHSTIKESTEQ